MKIKILSATNLSIDITLLTNTAKTLDLGNVNNCETGIPSSHT